MFGSKIIASGHYVPEDVVTNDDLAKVIDTSDEWIVSHTGIQERHVSLQGENTSDLATKAAQQALNEAGVSAEEVDFIIVTTFTPDGLAPSTAALVQRNLGAKKAFGFDLSTACAGFVFGLTTADNFMKTGQYRYSLVIAAEVNSKMMDFRDRTSTVFFGDGAGAVLLAPSKQGEVVATDLHTIGDADVVHSGRIEPLTSLSADNYPKIDAFFQEGRMVYQEVTTLIPNHIQEFLADQNLTIDDVDYVILHQANLRMIEKVAEALNQPMAKFVTNVETYGNSSSAGIAMAFDQLRESTDLANKKVLLTGFGAGFTYGSLLFQGSL
ncbi:beta-ketoacyl-ACP synthase III [Fructobacillus evanidus]|uniref:Beta-ketoacyl-[acyl-carrier-protein] synthase III n=1 Tax=Fructobacillus evanidus TaxID=3064281 RepID=A0ABM9MSJ0_9LACO|nr:3-oxoacyl-[acyl-carrier-protein] synthase III (FabH) [Fructobacillus sp. LMG 32999]CAK1234289.1 3-oxoacyl-[acyl-carrier-protein] synthase III (FabH) [Fructobacillus sp. LMG 32999]CAK1236297.1 3-oxoacyl-[acyl-carrier-protein] synthase III (FabH) [Fructobacillus sp. LMG 32999]CAK1236739.1 3-oxoacyl-[acyl-carrier-protein] synthase III (FabH) [Fructobacillus sp. LMG 32999]CAK1237019.1 3-oxoacyl-[acyl-carrier-protein] synthase III (FabH) [Fructobacillus sp. LMG 32999]